MINDCGSSRWRRKMFLPTKHDHGMSPTIRADICYNHTIQRTNFISVSEIVIFGCFVPEHSPRLGSREIRLFRRCWHGLSSSCILTTILLLHNWLIASNNSKRSLLVLLLCMHVPEIASWGPWSDVTFEGSLPSSNGLECTFNKIWQGRSRF